MPPPSGISFCHNGLYRQLAILNFVISTPGQLVVVFQTTGLIGTIITDGQA